MKFDIIVAGGGFAGAYCARTLGRRLGPDAARRVALISEDNVLTFQPMLAEVAGSSLSPLDVVNPLREFCRGVNVMRGRVSRIDWAGRTLHVDAGRFTPDVPVEFEHLVIAIGSIVDFSKVPGMIQHGLPMKTVAHAIRLRSAVINRLEEANLTSDPESRRKLLTFVVVGGGYTGVETAGQVLDFLQNVQPLYTNLGGEKVRMVLVHSRGHLLAEIGEELGDYAQNVLEKRGTEVLLNTRVVEVTVDEAVLDDGRTIETHTVISTVGNAPNPVVLDLCKQIGLETNKGRIPTERTMQVSGQTHLWAAGDCASIPWEAGTAPPTAQFAIREGMQLADNLAQFLSDAPLSIFTHRDLGQLATVGSHAAVAEVMGFHFSGFIAWWMWRTIYLAKLPGVLRKLRVVVDWTFELFFPRDISLLLPPPEDALRPVHFRQGETVFVSGAHSRGLIAVQSGCVTVAREAASSEEIRIGGMLDRRFQDENGLWNCRAEATEPTDVLILHGAALRLFPENPAPPAATTS